MPFSHSVDVPRGAVQWPPLCIRCGHTSPDAQLPISKRGWTSIFGAAYRADLPCCASCRGALSRNWWIHQAVLWIIAAIAIAGVHHFAPGLRLVVIGAIALGIGSVAVVIARFVAPPDFDMTVDPEKVSFDFARADVAQAFADLNHSTVE